MQIKPDDEFLLSPGKLADHPDKNDLWDMVFIVLMSFKIDISGSMLRGITIRTVLPCMIMVLILNNCGPGSAPSSGKDQMFQSDDSTIMFNGRTLDGWEITNFGTQGPVYVSGGAIILGMGDGCTGVTWKGDFPLSDYEITLEAKKIDGNDFFCGITFPVSGMSCTLITGGWGGTVVGISCINGKDASENETTRLMSFQKDRWYNIGLKVADGKIEARIDSAVVADFTIGEKRLSVRPEVELSKPFGVASWRTTAAIRNIRVHILR